VGGWELPTPGGSEGLVDARNLPQDMRRRPAFSKALHMAMRPYGRSPEGKSGPSEGWGRKHGET
jgi:hypothetical protein